MYRWGFQANVNEPVLLTHDRFGNRSDIVDFHPAWHSLMELSVSNGLHSLPYEKSSRRRWAGGEGRPVYARVAVRGGPWLPDLDDHLGVPALRLQADLAGVWEPRVMSRSYDRRFVPASAKSGAILGMGMTEKQGGSDVRSNTSVARPANGGGPGAEYRLTGHKWFTSAPMCDAFLVLAQAPGGLSCFLLPRFTPDGLRNSIQIQRLKDKLGNRSNASSEIEFIDAAGWMVGEEGRGVPTIIEMVNHTRLDCVVGSVALMRQAVSQAAWHAAHRRAFGGLLIVKPLMQNVVADLEIEVEAATLMMMRLSGAFDRADADPQEAAFRRLATPVAKYWVTKRCTPVVREAMECLGGNGYVEESIVPRLFRESPVNAIWEGSGNVIALDTMRALAREPASGEAFVVESELALGADPALDHAIGEVRTTLATLTDPEHEARRIVERLAVTWAASLMVRHRSGPAADAYVMSRISGDGGAMFGTLPTGAGTGSIAATAIPRVDRTSTRVSSWNGPRESGPIGRCRECRDKATSGAESRDGARRDAGFVPRSRPGWAPWRAGAATTRKRRSATSWSASAPKPEGGNVSGAPSASGSVPSFPVISSSVVNPSVGASSRRRRGRLNPSFLGNHSRVKEVS